MTVVYIVLMLFGGLTGGWAVTTFLLNRVRAKSLLNKAQLELSHAEEEIRDKKKRAEEEISGERREFNLEKKEKLHQLRADFEKETREKSKELHKLSETLIRREESLERQVVEIEKGKEKLTTEKQKLEKEKKEIKTLGVKQKEELERIAGMSSDEAKKELLETVKKEAQQEAAQIIQKVEREAKETAAEKAREIVAIAIQRCAVDEVTDATVSTVSLPDDEMKGRVIGKEGRNIKAFEALTGVDLIVNDTPEAVVISCFDPLRRKIAEMSLKRLIADGRIQPARIEDVVEEAKKDMERIVHREGQHAAFEIGISDLHSELIDLLGRLKFRTSYGQNALEHSKEVASISGMMTAELDIDSVQAKRAGLLHDIGKAVSQESNGSHALDGAKLAEKYGESPEVVHAIEVHHEDKEIDTLLARLVQAADAISAARPGARRETLEKYLKRVKEMEDIAYSFDGVKTAYAIRSGRELRIMVRPKEIDDWQAEQLSREIAAEIEKKQSFPGQIKVTVIRELRSTDYAKHK